MQHLRERIATHAGAYRARRRLADDRARGALARAGRARLHVVNRTPDKAAALAARFGATHSRSISFRREPPAIEALLTATGAEHAILDEAALERLAAHTPSGQPPLIVDMAVPPDVDPAACAKLAIPRVGMDEIMRRADQTRAARLIEARARARASRRRARHLQDRFTERYYGPLFGALQQRLPAHGAGRRKAAAEEGAQRASATTSERRSRPGARCSRAASRTSPAWDCAACCTTAPMARSRRS